MTRTRFFLITSILILILIPMAGLTAESSLSSFAGADIDFIPIKDNTPKLKLNGVFATQYNMNNNLLFRGCFGIKTEDIIENGFFQDTPSYFTINEFSAAYKLPTGLITQQLSIFMGKYESLGSDEFMQKNFSSINYASTLFTEKLSLFSDGIINYSGVGLSYSMRFSTPQAIGFYFYYDKKYEYNFLNFDLRFASAFDTVLLDIGAGAALPLETTDSNDSEVFLLIRRCDIHAGFSLLLGNNPVTNLFIQAGLQRIQIKPMPDTTNISLKDLFLFVEPRFTGNYLRCNVSFFCIPETQVASLPFIPQPIGCDIHLSSPDFIMFRTQTVLGIHAAVACGLTDDYKLKDLDIQITPYMDCTILGGSFNLVFMFHPMEYKDVGKFFNFSLSYKAEFCFYFYCSLSAFVWRSLIFSWRSLRYFPWKRLGRRRLYRYAIHEKRSSFSKNRLPLRKQLFHEFYSGLHSVSFSAWRRLGLQNKQERSIPWNKRRFGDSCRRHFSVRFVRYIRNKRFQRQSSYNV